MDNYLSPDKSKNPFAYFLLLDYILFAFLKLYTKRERKYLYTKYKASESTNLFGETSENSGENRNYNEKIRYNR